MSSPIDETKAGVEPEKAATEDLQREATAIPTASRPTIPLSGKKGGILPGDYGTRFSPRGDPSIDYEQKYPVDDVGLEMSAGARVWRVYLDEADLFDTEMVQKFMDTIDILLVFAGLFSAVVTTFVVETSQSLKPDYAQISASLLTEMVLLQRAIAQGRPGSVQNIPASVLDMDSDTSEGLDRVISGLWFTSLTFALSVALFAILVKQWLHNYISAYTGTPRDRALARQTRFDSLGRWGVPVIIGLLPLLLHIALLLFFIGLVLFVHQLEPMLRYTVLPLASLGYVAYFVSVVLPLIFPHCAYQTPVTGYLRMAVRLLRRLYTLTIVKMARDPNPELNKSIYVRARSTPFVEERHELVSAATIWLFVNGSNPTCKTIVAQASAARPPRDVVPWSPNLTHHLDDIRDATDSAFTVALRARGCNSEQQRLHDAEPTDEVFVRALLALQSTHLGIAECPTTEQAALSAAWLASRFEITSRIYFPLPNWKNELRLTVERTALSLSPMPRLVWYRLFSVLGTVPSRGDDSIRLSWPDKHWDRSLDTMALQILVTLGAQDPNLKRSERIDWYDSRPITFQDLCSSNLDCRTRIIQYVESILFSDTDYRPSATGDFDWIHVALQCVEKFAQNLDDVFDQSPRHIPYPSELYLTVLLADGFVCSIINQTWSDFTFYAPQLLKTIFCLGRWLKSPGQPSGRSYPYLCSYLIPGVESPFSHLESLLTKFESPITQLEYPLEMLDMLSSRKLDTVFTYSEKTGTTDITFLTERYIFKAFKEKEWMMEADVREWADLLEKTMFTAQWRNKIPEQKAYLVSTFCGLPVLFRAAATFKDEMLGTSLANVILSYCSYMARHNSDFPDTTGLATLALPENLCWLVVESIMAQYLGMENRWLALLAFVPGDNPAWRVAMIGGVKNLNKLVTDTRSGIRWPMSVSQIMGIYRSLREFARQDLNIVFGSSIEFAAVGYDPDEQGPDVNISMKLEAHTIPLPKATPDEEASPLISLERMEAIRLLRETRSLPGVNVHLPQESLPRMRFGPVRRRISMGMGAIRTLLNLGGSIDSKVEDVGMDEIV